MDKQLLLYYFSGTGNAKRVTYWIADSAKENDYNIDILDLSKTNRKNIPVPKSNTMIGFISPTHGFNYPPVTLYFILRFPRANNNQVFLVNTRAGMKLSKIFLPGLSGIALLFSALVLLLKGYKIIGMRPIDLPSNWISLHPGLKPQVVVSMFEHCKRITNTFANKVLNNKKDYRGLYDIVQDLLISPISILYFIMGRFILAKSFYANHNCNNCNLCIYNCSIKAIKLVSNRPFWTYRCESCMKCMNECPLKAIDTAHGFFFATLFLINGVVIIYFWLFVNKYIHLPGVFPFKGVLVNLIEFAITFIAFILSYRLFHFLLRLPLFQEIFEFTSLTRFKFWRRYKALKN